MEVCRFCVLKIGLELWSHKDLRRRRVLKSLMFLSFSVNGNQEFGRSPKLISFSKDLHTLV